MTNIIRFPIERALKVNGGQQTFIQAELKIVPKSQFDQALLELEAIASTDVFEQDQLTQRGIDNSSDHEANRQSMFQKWMKSGLVNHNK